MDGWRSKTLQLVEKRSDYIVGTETGATSPEGVEGEKVGLDCDGLASERTCTTIPRELNIAEPETHSLRGCSPAQSNLVNLNSFASPVFGAFASVRYSTES